MESDFTDREKQIMNILYEDPAALRRSPCVIYIQNSNIHYIGKNVHCENVLESIVSPVNLKVVTTPKITVKFYPLSQCHICMIDKKFFDARNVLDKKCYYSWFPSDDEYFNFEEKKVEKYGDLSLQDAFKKFNCTLSCNIDYYLMHKNEIWRDLKRRFKRRYKNDEAYIKSLGNQIFFKLLLNVLGDLNDKKEHDTQTIILKDFRLVYNWGGTQIGTSERGNHYIMFFYMAK